MKNKAPTVLFICVATVMNFLLMAVMFLLAYSAYYLIGGRFFPRWANLVIVLLIFAASVAATYFIYKIFVRIIMKKTRIGKYLHPIVK